MSLLCRGKEESEVKQHPHVPNAKAQDKKCRTVDGSSQGAVP